MPAETGCSRNEDLGKPGEISSGSCRWPFANRRKTQMAVQIAGHSIHFTFPAFKGKKRKNRTTTSIFLPASPGLELGGRDSQRLKPRPFCVFFPTITAGPGK